MRARDTITVGFREPILISRLDQKPDSLFVAKIDSGAKWARINAGLARSLGLRASRRLGDKHIRSAAGVERRKLTRARVRIAGRTFRVTFTISKATGVLLGRRTLGLGFVIDAARSRLTDPSTRPTGSRRS
jgi:hypothetical protein